MAILAATLLLTVGCADSGTEATPRGSAAVRNTKASRRGSPVRQTMSAGREAAADASAGAATISWQDASSLTVEDDPTTDGWETEAFSKTASHQLHELGLLLVKADAPQPSDVRELIADDFSCGPLRPDTLPKVFEDDVFHIARAEAANDDGVSATSPALRGAQGLARALRALRAPLLDTEDRRFKIKVVRVTKNVSSIRTRILFEFGGRRHGGSIQLNAQWLCHWRYTDGDDIVRLTRIVVTDYEEVSAKVAGDTLFSDCTESVFRSVRAFDEQLRRGHRYWFDRIERRLLNSFAGHHGIVVADVNGDGLDDVYLCQPGGLPNRLFIHRPDGTVEDVSRRAGVDVLDPTHSALLVDLDNDGDQDLLVATKAALIVLANDGAGTFIERARLPQVQEAFSLSAADCDGDGILDVYACLYFPSNEVRASGDFPLQGTTPLPQFDARNGGRNVLLKNDGNWQFRDLTDAIGLGEGNDRWSFAAAWDDYDNDGDVDLYVANDFGRNNLYRNDGGRFVEASDVSGVGDTAFGMSVAWGDYNHDGWMDLYLGNMFSAAGGRITYQERFREGDSARIKANFQRLARGNTLLENRGDGTFRDVSAEAGVSMGRWAWSSHFIDINNDMWCDLMVANGYITGENSSDL